jgi:branched-chain amino acid transport system ATP-binding protein
VDFGETIAIDTPERIQNNPDVIRAYLGEEHHVAALGTQTGSGDPR